jgi:hypothetical protein
MKRTVLLAALCTATSAAQAVDGEILITQAKALAGNVTPGDVPGFPVTLSLPGKYKLASNLTIADVDTTAIEIDSDLVSLDLNGFILQGPVTCSGFAGSHQCLPSNRPAIDANSRHGIHVRNGTISGFGGGIGTLGNASLAEDLLITEIGTTAISAGTGSIIRGNRLYRVGLGIVSSGLVINNTINGAQSNGIYSGYGGLVIGNQTYYTGGTGIVAYYQGDAALVHNAASIDGSSNDGVYGGVSLGGGTDNFCEGDLC